MLHEALIIHSVLQMCFTLCSQCLARDRRVDICMAQFSADNIFSCDTSARQSHVPVAPGKFLCVWYDGVRKQEPVKHGRAYRKHGRAYWTVCKLTNWLKMCKKHIRKKNIKEPQDGGSMVDSSRKPPGFLKRPTARCDWSHKRRSRKERPCARA